MITLNEMINLTGADKGAIYNKIIVVKNARVATTPQWITTIINGEVETPKPNLANIGDYIITGTKGEEYVQDKAKFEKLYLHIEGSRYETKPDSVQAVEVTTSLHFESPWGDGDMIANPGDYIVFRSETDAYRVQREIFIETYELA